jgi:hypothetical protein
MEMTARDNNPAYEEIRSQSSPPIEFETKDANTIERRNERTPEMKIT